MISRPDAEKPFTIGLHFGHDASVAAFFRNELVFVEYEDRLTRIKHHQGFPYSSLVRLLQELGITGKQVGSVAFSTENLSYPTKRNITQIGADGTASHFDFVPEPTRSTRLRELEKLASDWGDRSSRLHVAYQAQLEELGLFGDDVEFFQVNHHRCHAAINRLRGYRAGTCVTIDGRGDGITNCVFKMDLDQRLSLLSSQPADQSLCAFYQAVTEALGFVPVDAEYKIMGLAGCRQSPVASVFDDLFSLRGLKLESSVHWKWRDYNSTYPELANANKLSSVAYADEVRKLRTQYSDVDIASMAQSTFEKQIVGLVSAALQVTHSETVFGSGGGFLNAKANQRIQRAVSPHRLLVFPDSSDGGLSIGAAIEAIHFRRGRADFKFDSLSLGSSANSRASGKDHPRPQGKSSRHLSSPENVAQLIAKGSVVGIFQGRGQVGPRALGARSILADARDVAMKARINDRLKGREWFVPFAPVCLREDAARFFRDLEDRRYLMTETVDCTDLCRRLAPAIVHHDGTARPQIVEEEEVGWLRDILEAYRAISGMGLLLNTSFNRHGLPICGSEGDALMHFDNRWIDALVISEDLLINSEPVA